MIWRLLLLSTLALIQGSWLMPPTQAQVQNLEYGIRELEVTAEGVDAHAALENCEIQALEQALQELIQTPLEAEKYQVRRQGLMARRAEFVRRLQIVGKGTTADDGRFYRIRFAVDLGKLRTELISSGVILSQQALREQLNFPTIAAYYNDPREQSAYALWAVERLNNYLLAHEFKVIDAKIWQRLAAEDALLLQSQGSGQRLAQAMAQKARADIFLAVQIEPQIVGQSGEFTYVQTPVEIKAYEASSGEPFITKVYQRLSRQGEPEALAIRGNLDVTAKAVIEEAVAGAMPLVLADLTRHWKDNLLQGSQYRLRFVGLNEFQRRALESELGRRTRTFQRVSEGNYLVRYQGPLVDLSDALEAWYEQTYGQAFKTHFDLGQAEFSL